MATHETRGGMDGTTALRVRGLRAAYGAGADVLSGVNLDVQDGEVVALLGANGAGKTSLVRCVTRLIGFHGGRITAGSVESFGRPLPARANAVVRAGISQSLEGRRVFPDLNVLENLRAGGLTRPGSEVAGRIDGVLAMFPSLKRRETTAAGYLSGGEQQMLAIGRALMQDPKVLVLDEPTLGLAPVMVGQIRDLVSELNANGTTILLIEQNVAMSLAVSHRAYVLERGAVVHSGRSADLRDDDAIRKAYLGLGEDAA